MSVKTTENTYVETGAYSIVGATGTMAAELAAASPIFSFRWATATANAKALIDRIAISVHSLGTGFAAGVGLVEVLAARGFSAADTDGAALTVTGNNAKRRTTMATTELTEARISTTATLTAGTRTLDDQPFGSLLFGVTTAVNTAHLPTANLWFPYPTTYPLVLAANEGFVIRATVPATGTWKGIITVDWREVLG